MKQTYQTIFLIILLITTFLLFNSCATILKGTTEGVDVDSAPTGAKVYINGQYMGKTPLQVKLRSNKTHHIEFVKEGYEKKTVDITSSLGANWVIIDVLFGVFPIIIDAASGSWYNLDDSYARTLLEKEGVKHEARESELSSEPGSESETSPPFLILELSSDEPRAIFLDKIQVLYEVSGFKESSLSFKGIWGLADDPNQKFEQTSLFVEKGKVFFVQIDAKTIYRVEVIQETAKILTLDFKKQ